MCKKLEKWGLPVGVNTEFCQYGILEKEHLYLEREPHTALIGPSGSGKTYLAMRLLGYLALCKPEINYLAHEEVELIVADWKGIDFSALHGCKRYYQHSRVSNALEDVYNILQERMERKNLLPKDCHPIVFFTDEWSSYICSLDRQQSELRKKQLSSLISLGRGVRIFCILALQRGDAEYFGKSRDNIGNVIMLGNCLSKESLKMWCTPEEIEKMNIRYWGKGKGYMKCGTRLVPITIPRINSKDKLLKVIREALDRDFY